jgi:ribosomal-protein-alanine N-acetyltransferase
MTAQLPSWPTTPPAHGCVVLREFADEDAHLAVELGDDPYIPLIGSLPAQPTAEQALAWIRRQRSQLTERERFSFAIADAESNTAVGAIGLGLRDLSAGRATAGYAVSPLHRGRGIATSALQALTRFAWTIPALYRVELYIEPWNTSSIHVAEAAGYRREGLLHSHQEIGGTRRHAALCDNAILTAALSSVTRRRPHRRGLRRRSCTTSRIISAINSPRVIGDHHATAQRIPVCSSASALSLARSLRLVVTISFPTPESKTRPMGPPATR